MLRAGNDLSLCTGAVTTAPCKGFMLLPHSLEALTTALERLPAATASTLPHSVLHVVLDPSSILPEGAWQAPLAPTASIDGADVWPPLTYRNSIERKLCATMAACKDCLRQRGIASISFVCVTPNSDVFRLGFMGMDGVALAGEQFVQDEVLSFVEPPTAAMLETKGLPPVAMYVPSHAHQLHSFVVQVLPCSPVMVLTVQSNICSYKDCPVH
jgi:hypothetical protein